MHLFILTSYFEPGKKSKRVNYFSSENAKKYGYKTIYGIKYYPNGKERFSMEQFPESNLGTARLYDVNGTVIKDRVFKLPQMR